MLEAHLGEGDEINPESWRAALRVFEYRFGRPGELPEQEQPQTIDVRALTPERRAALMARVLEDNPGLAALVPAETRTTATPKA